jgi:Flp pilus assembly protein TadB
MNRGKRQNSKQPRTHSHVQKRYPCLTIATARPLVLPKGYRTCSVLVSSSTHHMTAATEASSNLQPSTSLEQAIQTTATSQRTHDTRANTTARRSASASVIHVLALRRIALLLRVALLRVHRLLLVLHGWLVVALLLAAIVVVLRRRRSVRARPAHGWCR